jgi:hypothetical protein
MCLKTGNPLDACQRRFGRKIKKPAARPYQNFFFFKISRYFVKGIITTNPIKRRPARYLFSNAIPAVTPKIIRKLSLRVFIYFIIKYIHNVQRNISINTGIKRKYVRRKKFDIKRPKAARNAEYFEPPSSFAIEAARQIRAPPRRAGKSRTAKTECPKRICISQAIQPTKGGTVA